MTDNSLYVIYECFSLRLFSFHKRNSYTRHFPSSLTFFVSSVKQQIKNIRISYTDFMIISLSNFNILFYLLVTSLQVYPIGERVGGTDQLRKFK